MVAHGVGVDDFAGFWGGEDVFVLGVGVDVLVEVFEDVACEA